MQKRVPHSELRNVAWNVWQEADGKYTAESVERAILLDIREELRQLNRLLHCSNFIQIPRTLRAIERNTKKRARKRTPNSALQK